MEPIFLTDIEIRDATGLQLASAQCRALEAMGILFKKRPNGKPLVSRAHIVEVMGGMKARTETTAKEANVVALLEHWKKGGKHGRQEKDQ